MAATIFSPISSVFINTGNRDLGFLSKSSSLLGSLPFSSSSFSHHGNPTFSRSHFMSPRAKSSSYGDVPEQFRLENLDEEEVMDNIKNVPELVYGLPPSQMNLLMGENSPLLRHSEEVTEQCLSLASYVSNGGMWSSRGMGKRGPSNYSTSVPMSEEDDSPDNDDDDDDGIDDDADDDVDYGPFGKEVSYSDADALLKKQRIIFLGVPLYPEVTEYVINEIRLMYKKNQTKPIHFYLGCTGVRDDDYIDDIVGDDQDAYAIVDYLASYRIEFCTCCYGEADGQAAMLLSLGKKGYRYMMPSATVSLYLPEIEGSVGTVREMVTEAEELELSTRKFLLLLSKGTGKSVEELAEDLKKPMFFTAEQAIEYGIADKIIEKKK